MSHSFSFASKISRLVLGDDRDDDSQTLTPESPALFSPSSSSSSLFPSLVHSMIVSPVLPQPTPPGATRQSLPSPLSPISIPRPLILSSTPVVSLPNTQQLANQMIDLRSVDGIDAVVLQRENVFLQRENESLKSEVTALRLQREDDLQEISRLRLLHSPSSPAAQPQQPPPANQILAPYVSKKKRKKMRKKEGLANLPATEATIPPGCELPPLNTRPPPPTPSPSQPTAYIFHDSNLKHLTASEIENSINNIKCNIKTHMTFTLSQTLDAIRQTTFQRTDIVIITTLTNDARQTKHRHARTPNQTKNIQTTIINHLKPIILPLNIVFLEAPPLLTSPFSDIYPYNKATSLVTQQHNARFAETLLGEFHLFKDGFHILRSARNLLVKSVAAAVANVNPHKHFKRLRPPHGNFGPWTSPNGQGILPSPTVLYGRVAMVQPINFRRAAIRPLMDINIPRFRY